MLGPGTPVSSYTVIDDTAAKLFSATPVNLMTTEELMRDGYSPIAEIMASPKIRKYTDTVQPSQDNPVPVQARESNTDYREMSYIHATPP